MLNLYTNRPSVSSRLLSTFYQENVKSENRVSNPVTFHHFPARYGIGELLLRGSPRGDYAYPHSCPAPRARLLLLSYSVKLATEGRLVPSISRVNVPEALRLSYSAKIIMRALLYHVNRARSTWVIELHGVSQPAYHAGSPMKVPQEGFEPPCDPVNLSPA